MKRKIISSLLLLFMLMSTIIAQPVLAKSEGNVVGQKLTFNAKDFGLSEYESTQTKREQSYRAKNPRRVKRYARLFSNGVSFRSAQPDSQLGFDPKTEFLFPLRLQILTKNSKAGTEAGGINLNDIGLKDGFKIKINQIDSRGNIKNVFESDKIIQDGLTATDAKTGDAKGIVTFKYAAGSEDVTEGRRTAGEAAENVRIYDDYGKAFSYEIVADDAVEYNIQLRVRKTNADPAYNKNYIHIELQLIQIANSTMKNEVVDKTGKDIRSELKDGQKLIAYFGRIQGGANYFIDFSKTQTVLRKDFGDQKLIALNDLSIISKNRYHLRRAEALSWNDDGYVTLKDKNDKDIAFKVETSYDCVKGGLVKFIKQDKVIIPDDPGTGGTSTPCPSTHYEVNFKAGANGTLKKGMKTRFFVQKGLTWKEAKEADPKLTVPVPVPIKDFKLDDWYKVVNGKVDKTKTATKGLPKDETKVETATYQAEFIGKNKVVDVTPTDPNVTPELPKKPNPDFDPNKKEDPNSNPKTIPDDDYELITFKAGDNGFLSADKIKIKVYAVLKTSTWAEAEKATPKMDVPSADSTTLKLTGADNYTFTKWTKEDKETEVKFSEYGSKKISELTDKTFIAKFEANEIERENKETPIPDGYIRLEFSPGNDGKIADNNTAKTIIDVLEKANKKVGDYTKPTITPKVGYSQKKDTEAWDKADSLVINSKNADKTSAKKNELTVTAQYDKKKSIIDITPTPPTPPTPGPTPDPNPPYIPGTKTPDPDYIVVAFKAGANGKIKCGNKFYAILKNMTWKEAQEYTPAEGETKLVVPSEFEPETGYGFVNWDPTLPTDDSKKLGELVQAGQTKLTYIAKFDKDIKEDDNKDEEGYLRVVFDGNGGTLKGNVKNSYKVRVGVTGVAGSESSKKTYADLERFKKTDFVAADNTTDDGITPPIDQKFKEWRKGDETTKLEGTTEIQGESKSVITVKAQYESETALVVPSITQTVNPALPADEKDDDNSAKKVLKVNFANDPTTGATYKIVKEDGTEVATVTNPQKGDNFVEIPSTVVDKDIVKVKVTKPGMNDQTSSSITLDLAGPTFENVKIVKNTPHLATITGKVTDTPAGVYWVKIEVNGKTIWVDTGLDGTFKKDIPITTNDEYTLTAKDNLANISEKKTSTSDVDKNNSFDKSKIKKVTIEQGYTGEKEILVFAEEGATVKLYKFNGETETVLGEVTISSGMGVLSISDANGLAANERIYAIVIKDASNNDISKFNTPAIMTVRPVTVENVTPPTDQPQPAAEGTRP